MNKIEYEPCMDKRPKTVEERMKNHGPGFLFYVELEMALNEENNYG